MVSSSVVCGRQQSVAIPQAAKGRARPPCCHFKNQSCYCLRSAFEMAAFPTRCRCSGNGGGGSWAGTWWASWSELLVMLLSIFSPFISFGYLVF
jgi:hypothetical protein